jgi:hypothetical protein
MTPRYPIYIVSKGRADSRLTSKMLERQGVPYRIVVEAQEADAYRAVIDPHKVLVLDPAYQRDYDTCDDLGDTKSKGPGPARNFAWAHSLAQGATSHWVMDDNIRRLYRMNRNAKIDCGTGTGWWAMEEFADRYANIAMCGPRYDFFAPRKQALPPLNMNTRIYSCNLIRNHLPFRWRGRYNEDTDLSLVCLKAGWVTLEFTAFLQKKMSTQLLAGGCTTEFYAHEGTGPKSRLLVKMHPDVTRLTFRFGRVHHHVDYRPFKANRLVRKPGLEMPIGVDEFGMVLQDVPA